MKLEKAKEFFSSAIPDLKSMGYAETQILAEVSFAVDAIKKSKDLQQCERATWVRAFYNVLSVGLSLNPVKGEAALVPRYNRRTKEKECGFQPMYRGLVKLIVNGSAVTSVICNAVYDADDFSIDLADNIKPVTHRPSLRERGEIIGFYAIATYEDGTRVPEWMTAEDVNEIRNSTDSWKAYKAGRLKSCIWDDHYSEMGRKTVIRRIAKRLPVSGEMLAKAEREDNRDFPASPRKRQYVEYLIDNSTFDDDRKAYLEDQAWHLSNGDADELILELERNQRGQDISMTGGSGNKGPIFDSIKARVENPKA